jgi:iron-sulfur cluster assembly protein
MLTVTENAVTLIKGLLTSADQADHGGLRIGVKSGADLGVGIAAAPLPHDEVIEDGGARCSS